MSGIIGGSGSKSGVIREHGIRQILTGTNQLTSGDVGNVQNGTITFSKPFANIPVVTINASLQGSFSDSFAVTIREITTTNFTWNLCRVDSTANWSATIYSRWIAIDIT
jgi:hypothetical protein